MSFEASAKGTSAETTPVILESMLHEPQTKLQSSLPLTPRPPIDGKPSACKQEVADSVTTAGRTNRTAKMAEPTEIADVDRTPLLGGEPAERASGVDEGDGMEHGYPTRLQQTILYCKEDQRSGNTNANIPSAYGVPLEGEWTGYASSEARDLKGSASMPNVMPECVHSPSESRETEDAKGVELEGCEKGTSEHASVDGADRDPD